MISNQSRRHRGNFGAAAQQQLLQPAAATARHRLPARSAQPVQVQPNRRRSTVAAPPASRQRQRLEAADSLGYAADARVGDGVAVGQVQAQQRPRPFRTAPDAAQRVVRQSRGPPERQAGAVAPIKDRGEPDDQVALLLEQRAVALDRLAHQHRQVRRPVQVTGKRGREGLARRGQGDRALTQRALAHRCSRSSIACRCLASQPHRISCSEGTPDSPTPAAGAASLAHGGAGVPSSPPPDASSAVIPVVAREAVLGRSHGLELAFPLTGETMPVTVPAMCLATRRRRVGAAAGRCRRSSISVAYDL
eukprot:scaffold31071_cov101-Isochrysis_galbana.AAC.2